MIRCCLFDLGNVLAFFSHERMCKQIGALCGKNGEEIRRILFADELNVDFECGRLSEREFHARFESAVECPVDLNALRRAASDIFQLNEPVVPVLDALHHAGMRLVLLSNTSVSHFNWVREQYDVLDRFDDFVLSFEVGSLKPDAAMYESALQTIGCEPGECFYTDDIEQNITAGRQCGLRAELFTDVPALRRQLGDLGAL